jgi:muramoyltetrapeptide carboxypeptidase LdcA involved in peptidoglycan recycling
MIFPPSSAIGFSTIIGLTTVLLDSEQTGHYFVGFSDSTAVAIFFNHQQHNDLFVSQQIVQH